MKNVLFWTWLGLMIGVVVLGSLALAVLTEGRAYGAPAQKAFDYQRLQHSFVNIMVSGTTKKSAGSGVVIYHDSKQALILTCAHVVVLDEPIQLNIVMAESMEDALDLPVEFVVEKVDAEQDLALIRTTDPLPRVQTISLAWHEAKRWEPVWGMGNADGDGATASSGVISSRKHFVGEARHRFYRLTMPIFFGMSGGPLVNADGELVGIMSNIYKWCSTFIGETQVCGPVTTFGLAVPLERIRKFLRGTSWAVKVSNAQ